MNPRHHRHWPARRIHSVAIGLAATGTAALLTACGSPSRPAAAASTGISPGAGQSLAGVPGATGTGSMPGMTMSVSAGASSGPAAAPAVPVSGNAVAITNFTFAPAALTVKVGTTVTWTNKDGDAHTVTSQGSGGPLKSAALDTGGTYSFTFTTPGTYAYLCTIHPFMTATVTVTP
jgi:plastocyanin